MMYGNMEDSMGKQEGPDLSMESNQSCKSMDSTEDDTKKLVNNSSDGSFESKHSNTSEVTITKTYRDKYSKMCFHPTANNTVDIIITRGHNSSGKRPLLEPYPATVFMSSEQIRRKHSLKIKICFTIFVLMILGLVILAVYAIINLNSRLQDSNSGIPQLLHTGDLIVSNIVNSTANTFFKSNGTAHL